jgi:hypothetical protein
MTTPSTTSVGNHRSGAWALRRSVRIALLPLAALVAACGADQLASASGPQTDAPSAAVAHGHGAQHEMSSRDRAKAMLATAGFQDVATAEAAGYGSSIDTLGCFQDPTKGGMGLHYINQDLLDATLDPTKPEALVYELDLDGKPIGLVAHEYIVPVDAWSSRRPPRLFGMELHRHSTLPLWVLHTWLWKDNPRGVFDDWNPAVRLCPPGVPIFGVDLPEAAPDS